MQQDKVKIELSGVSASLLPCLWVRAQLSKEYSSLFYDEKAIELVERIDFDFSTSDVPFQSIWLNISRKLNLPPCGPPVLRAKHFDDKIRAYIAEHPHASVISLAAGLDTTFYRVDNGTIRWYDLDLPAVIDIRRRLLPEPDRVTYIAKSLLDPSWCKDVNTEDGVFMIAGGVFQFFEESEMKQFFSMLADNFSDGEIVFDVLSKLDVDFGAWIDMLPQEQRDAMRAAWMEAWMEALKGWWEKAPQDQKDKVNDMIAALETPTKPNGKEWPDLEAWWNKLSDTEKEGLMRDYIKSSSKGVMKWALEDANDITKWDDRITVLDQFPLYRDIPRDSLSAEMRQFMDYSDRNGRFNIVHLRV
ncbi:MAG TPA: class I SAM-dependent methyltransferase [Candidatus Acidoferrales bacterium]|nr:class I SAM-dependent methyltransferase [Candidatus Acidoferrales bacterium]